MSLESSQPASPVQSSRHTLPDAGSKCDGEDEAKRAKLDHSQSQVSSHPRARGDHANESGSESDEEDTSGLLLKTQKPVSTELPVALNSTNQSSESSTPKIVRGPMQGRVDLPRKVALLFMYYGVGYYGLQRNPNSRALFSLFNFLFVIGLLLIVLPSINICSVQSCRRRTAGRACGCERNQRGGRGRSDASAAVPAVCAHRQIRERTRPVLLVAPAHCSLRHVRVGRVRVRDRHAGRSRRHSGACELPVAAVAHSSCSTRYRCRSGCL